MFCPRSTRHLLTKNFVRTRTLGSYMDIIKINRIVDLFLCLHDKCISFGSLKHYAVLFLF